MHILIIIFEPKVTWRNVKVNRHADTSDKERDCGIGACSPSGRTEEAVFKSDKQILLAKEYYIFDKGQRLSGVAAYETLDVNRGFSFIEKGHLSRASVLTEFLKKNHSFKFGSGTDPFKGTGIPKGGGCKRK